MYSFVENFAINERIDDLYLGLLIKLPFSTGELKDVKKIFILSYENACVECGLSINEQMLENERALFSGLQNKM